MNSIDNPFVNSDLMDTTYREKIMGYSKCSNLPKYNKVQQLLFFSWIINNPNPTNMHTSEKCSIDLQNNNFLSLNL